MPTYTLTRYPVSFESETGQPLLINPMTRDDVDALVEFFAGIPDVERYLYKENVISREVVQRWADQLDYDKALPLLVRHRGRIVADGVLIRHRGNARSHSAEIRVTVAPEWAERGLDLALMRELAEIAYDADLEFVLLEFVEVVQQRAIEAAAQLGACETARIDGGATDLDGHHRDVIIYKLPLGKSWVWSRP